MKRRLAVDLGRVFRSSYPLSGVTLWAWDVGAVS